MYIYTVNQFISNIVNWHCWRWFNNNVFFFFHILLITHLLPAAHFTCRSWVHRITCGTADVPQPRHQTDTQYKGCQCDSNQWTCLHWRTYRYSPLALKWRLARSIYAQRRTHFFVVLRREWPEERHSVSWFVGPRGTSALYVPARSQAGWPPWAGTGFESHTTVWEPRRNP